MITHVRSSVSHIPMVYISNNHVVHRLNRYLYNVTINPIIAWNGKVKCNQIMKSKGKTILENNTYDFRLKALAEMSPICQILKKSVDHFLRYAFLVSEMSFLSLPTLVWLGISNYP